MIKPGRYDRDIRQPAAEGWSFAEKSFVSQELHEEYPGDTSWIGSRHLTATTQATVLNNFNDPRRVKITCLDGQTRWDGEPHEATDYLLEGMFKAEHSQHSKSDTLVSSGIINNYEEVEPGQDKVVTIERSYPGKKHNVTFSIRSKLATTIQLQYGVWTNFTYNPNPNYPVDINRIKPTWTNCGTSISVDAGGHVFINSGEIVLPDNVPPMVSFQLLVVQDPNHIFEISHDSVYHTGFLASKNKNSSYNYTYHDLAQQNYYSSVIPAGWTETNMPVHLATRMRVAGAPEHFTRHTDGKFMQVEQGLASNRLGYEGNQAPAIDPANCYEAEINQPKEVFNMSYRELLPHFYAIPDITPPYTKLYLKDIGFRNYSGLTSPGQRLWKPDTTSGYYSFHLSGVQGHYIFRRIYSTAKRITVWARFDAQGTGSSQNLVLYSVNDLTQKPDPGDLADIQAKCTQIGSSSSISINGGTAKHVFTPNSTENKLYLFVHEGVGISQNIIASSTVVITTPATPPLFDVLNIKGAVDPSKLSLENGLRFTMSDTLVNYPGDSAYISVWWKPEITYTDEPVEVTIPFTIMGNSIGINTNTMCVCFNNPQIPGVSGDSYFYANCDVEAIGGTTPKTSLNHGVTVWDGGTVSRNEVGGFRTRSNSEIGMKPGFLYSDGLDIPSVGFLPGPIFPNGADTYTKNGVPIYVYFTVNRQQNSTPPTSIKITLKKNTTTIVPIDADGSELNYFQCTSFTAPTSGTYEVEAWGEKNTFITSKNLNNLNDAVMKLKTDTCQYLPNGYAPPTADYYVLIIKNKTDWDYYIPDYQTRGDFLVLDSFEDNLPESIFKNKHIRYDRITGTFKELRLPGALNEKTCINFDSYDYGLSPPMYVRKSYSYDPVTKKIEHRTKKDKIRLEAGETVYTRVVDYGYAYEYRTTQNHRRITFTPDEP